MLGKSAAAKSFTSPLTQVTFSAYEDPDCKKKLQDGKKWYGLYDPKGFKLTTETLQVEKRAGIGTPAKKTEYQGVKSPVLDIQLTLDDTIYLGKNPSLQISGIEDSLNPDKEIVQLGLKELEELIVEYDGSIHRPPFVQVAYGGDKLFKGYCSKFDINKEKFDTDGVLRLATVSLQFKGTKSIELALKEANNQSPDITHHYVVRDGDSLATISYKVYGTTGLYLELARANKLNSTRYVKPGTRLVLPPLEK